MFRASCLALIIPNQAFDPGMSNIPKRLLKSSKHLLSFHNYLSKIYCDFINSNDNRFVLLRWFFTNEPIYNGIFANTYADECKF